MVEKGSSNGGFDINQIKDANGNPVNIDEAVAILNVGAFKTTVADVTNYNPGEMNLIGTQINLQLDLKKQVFHIII